MQVQHWKEACVCQQLKAEAGWKELSVDVLFFFSTSGVLSQWQEEYLFHMHPVVKHT